MYKENRGRLVAKRQAGHPALKTHTNNTPNHGQPQDAGNQLHSLSEADDPADTDHRQSPTRWEGEAMPESRVCGNPEGYVSNNENSLDSAEYPDSTGSNQVVSNQHRVGISTDLQLGCVFCKTGQEEAAARLLNTTARMHYAFVPKKVEHRSEKGIRTTTQKVLFPGYVFFQAEPDWHPTLLMYHADYILRILTKDGSWHLHGDDAHLVQWLMEHDGLLGMSKAYAEGTRVIIKSGPLKELEGIITKVDRHNRNGMVTLDLFGRKTTIWLPFELMESEADRVGWMH